MSKQEKDGMEQKGSRMDSNTKKGFNKNDRSKSRTHSGNPKNDYCTQDKKYNGQVKYGSNPVEWYIANDQLAKDSASLPYNVMTGRILTEAKRIDEQQTFDKSAFPGICKISFMTSVGYSDSATSAINTASRAIYSWVRHQNSGHTNYEAPDLTIYIMSMMEIYAAYFEACRVYKIAMTYKLTNRYTPKSILTSLGVDSEDVCNNLAQFRAGLNLVASKLSSMAVPNNFTTFYRHAMLLSNVFMDSESERGQYYVFSRSHFRVFDATGSTGGYLRTVSIGKQMHTAQDILDALNLMLDAVLKNEDMNIMSGDILKTYDLSSLYVVPGVHEDETVNFVYDESVLAQIENAICQFDDELADAVADPVSYSGLDIGQRDGYIIHTPTMTAKAESKIPKYWDYKMINYYILNSHKDNPDYKFNIEATRLMNVNEASGNTGLSYKIICGSELVTSIKYFYNSILKGTSEIVLEEIPYSSNVFCISDTDAWPISTEYLLRRSTIEQCFDWHPFTYITEFAINPGNISRRLMPAGDVDVYSLVDEETIKNVHDVVLLSQFRTKLLS